jgi:TRAP-type C4-dicarboxylate transport system permease large subunit
LNKPKRKWQVDQAGWGFFAIAFVVIAPISVYLVITSTYDTVNPVVRVFSALFVAAVVAGIVTAVTNSILQWRAEQRRELAKKSQASVAAGAKSGAARPKKPRKK